MKNFKKLGVVVLLFLVFSITGMAMVDNSTPSSGFQLSSENSQSQCEYGSDKWTEKARTNTLEAIENGNSDGWPVEFWLLLGHLETKKTPIFQKFCFDKLLPALREEIRKQNKNFLFSEFGSKVKTPFDFTKITGVPRQQLLQLYEKVIQKDGKFWTKPNTALQKVVFPKEKIHPDMKKAYQWFFSQKLRTALIKMKIIRSRLLFFLTALMDASAFVSLESLDLLKGDKLDLKFSKEKIDLYLGGFLREVIWMSYLDFVSASSLFDRTINSYAYFLQKFLQFLQGLKNTHASAKIDVVGKPVDVTSLVHSSATKVSELKIQDLKILAKLKVFSEVKQLAQLMSVPVPSGEKSESSVQKEKEEKAAAAKKAQDKKTALTIGLATGGGVLLLAGGGFLYWFYKIKK